jgi:hypothetical protein
MRGDLRPMVVPVILVISKVEDWDEDKDGGRA